MSHPQPFGWVNLPKGSGIAKVEGPPARRSPSVLLGQQLGRINNWFTVNKPIHEPELIEFVPCSDQRGTGVVTVFRPPAGAAEPSGESLP